MEKAMSLVGFEEDNLIVSKEALEKMSNLPSTYEIKMTAIVGPGRCGKSSLMNWLVGKNVFKIGSTTSRVTKGIWVYIDEDRGRKLANIYIDVEGFGDPSKANVNENDNRLLNIVIQVCDVVLYNIRGVYDSDMCDKIKCVCSLFNRYRKGNKVLEKPILVTVMRDFDLDKPENPDEEFQNLFSKNPELLDTFRETKAFTLVKPKEGKVIDLANTPDKKLSQEFITERNEIKKYLTEKTKPLRLRAAQKKIITGKVLADNIQITVEHVNNDDLRMLSKSLPEILKEKNADIKKSALDTYITEMTKKWPLPSQPETLMGLHEMEMNVALKDIEKKCFSIPGSVDIDEGAFKVGIEEKFKEMQKNKCQEALESAISEIKDKLEKKAYFEDGGETCFLNDLDEAKTAYTKYKNLGPEKLGIWRQFNETMMDNKELIKQKANIRALEKKAASLTEGNKEITKELEKARKEFDEKKKEFEKNQKNNNMLQGILSAGMFAMNCARGATEMYRNISTARGAGLSSLALPKDTGV